MPRGHSFVKGAFILGAAGLTARFLGAGLRIFLAAFMGDEGIGLYQMAYPIYTTLLAVSTAGIPIAISKLVAENLAYREYIGAYRVFRASLMILLFLGTLFSFILYFGAEFFVETILKDPRAYYPLITISPAIFLVSIMSAWRGFFQGQQEMLPTALSQIVEQLGRIVVVVILVFLLLPLGIEFAAAGAAFGAVAGGVFGLVILLYIYFRRRKDFFKKMKMQGNVQSYSTLQIFRRIITFSIPITLGSLVLPLINLVDLSVVPLRLHEAGYSTEEATSLYGQLTGMANSVVQFPIMMTIALAMSLVPAISEADALQSRALIRGRTQLALRVTLLFSIPAAVGLFVLSEPITIVLFDNAPASYPLSILAFGVIFLSLYTSTAGILQGLGNPIEPVKNMFLGAVLKFVISWFLTAQPLLNVGGAALSTVIGFFIASFLNIKKVKYLTGSSLNTADLLVKPIFASFIMAWSALMAYEMLLEYVPAELSLRMAQALSLLVTILLAMVVYVLVLSLIGGIREEDLRYIPRFGDSLARIARRLGLIKD